MSKSKGNVLYADTLVDFFGVDAVRYFVLHEMPFENDGVIYLGADGRAHEFRSGQHPGQPGEPHDLHDQQIFWRRGGEQQASAEAVDEDLKAAVLEAVKKADEKMDKLRVADAITEIFGIFSRSNKYIDETTPWTLAKDEEKKDRLATVLYNLTEAITIGASLLHPSCRKRLRRFWHSLNTQKRTSGEHG